MTRTTVVPNVMYVSSSWKLAANLTQQSMKCRGKLMFMGHSVSFFVPGEKGDSLSDSEREYESDTPRNLAKFVTVK